MRKIAAATAFVLIFAFALALNVNALTLTYDGITEEYPWDPITLTVNGETVDTGEMPPVILGGRTLVPAREFFEQLGATVEWIQDFQRVVIDYQGEEIILTINSRTVFIGDRAVTIPGSEPAPKIINDKTMIPVRIVTEGFGFDVEWINETRTVSITEKNEPEETAGTEPTTEGSTYDTLTITDVKSGIFSGNEAIYIYISQYETPTVFAMQNPERLVMDFYGAESSVSDGSISVGGLILKSVRYSAHEDRFRIVADLNSAAGYRIEKFNGGIVVALLSDTSVAELPSEESSEPSTEASDKLASTLENAGQYTVVIDAGHGGSDPGAMFPINSQNPEIKEKDITLDIALKVNSLLTAAGVKTVMTRTGDTYPTLQERAEIANNSGADLFVSIHCNSIENKYQIGGAQVYYHAGSETGKKFAQLVYDNIVEYTGMTARGIQDGSSLYVIKHTSMTAILTEGGFVSNSGDRAYLLSEEGRQTIANAISDGIIEMLSTM